MNKMISENQYVRVLNKGCTVNLKGFESKVGKVEGLIRFNENFDLIFEEKKIKSPVIENKQENQMICPKCKKGYIIKGNSAYGCSDYKSGCDFVFSFSKIREIAKGNPLTKELVYGILVKNI
jgi:DNA topoisomerase-3